MSTGLIALLDDVAALARLAAASLDDVAAQASKAGMKAAGVVIDDAAVTPRYVTGFAASRELPIIWRIALGSLKNKLVFLLPGALALSFFAPWAITPLLMLGGAYLCYEGAEKLHEAVFPHAAAAPVRIDPAEAQAVEATRIASAIRTDFILSAEIMALTLAGLPEGSVWMHGTVLAVVGLAVTIGVYGAVALIVKADDLGVALAASSGGALVRALGRGLVLGMPGFLALLGAVGTAAMLWVGGGILLHGLEAYGVTAPGHWLHGVAAAAAGKVPAAAGLVEWLVTALGSGVVGLAMGAALVPLVAAGAAVVRRLRPQAAASAG